MCVCAHAQTYTLKHFPGVYVRLVSVCVCVSEGEFCAWLHKFLKTYLCIAAFLTTLPVIYKQCAFSGHRQSHSHGNSDAVVVWTTTSQGPPLLNSIPCVCVRGCLCIYVKFISRSSKEVLLLNWFTCKCVCVQIGAWGVGLYGRGGNVTSILSGHT